MAMANHNQPSLTARSPKAYEVTQALVGLALDDSDEKTLRYLNFFTKQVPFTAAYFMHVRPWAAHLSEAAKKAARIKSDEYALNEVMVKKMEGEVTALLSRREDIYTEYDVREGNPLEELTQVAEQLKIDLLVIGQRIGRAPHRILAKNLIRNTASNVLVIPDKAAKNISEILVPIDFSENSGRALQHALQLQKGLSNPSRITCLYIYNIPSLKHFRLEGAWIQTKKSVESNIKDGFNAFMETYAPGFREQVQLALVEKTRPGIARYIIDYAEEHHCDFMCIGAKGHSKVHLLLMGSVTEEVMDINENLPTLVIR